MACGYINLYILLPSVFYDTPSSNLPVVVMARNATHVGHFIDIASSEIRFMRILARITLMFRGAPLSVEPVEAQ